MRPDELINSFYSDGIFICSRRTREDKWHDLIMTKEGLFSGVKMMHKSAIKNGAILGGQKGVEIPPILGWLKWALRKSSREDLLRPDRWGHRFYKENHEFRRGWRIIRFKRTSSLVEIRPFDAELIDD